jgi:CubicO group peptidase (beta-lactamase class C family)
MAKVTPIWEKAEIEGENRCMFRRMMILPCLAVVVPLLADPPAKTAPAAARNLKAVLEPIRREYQLPALTAAIVLDRKLVAEGTVGVRRAEHHEAVALHDRFHIGSCTKSMTATLCAILVEKGRLKWTTTIEEEFPKLKDKLHPDYHEVTLDHLLNHRSGLPDDKVPDAVLQPKIRALKGPIKEQRLALIRLVLQEKPKAPPGTKFQYSNNGYTIAAAMCEEASGESWEDLMRECLFRPLGMTTAGFGPPGTAGAVDEPCGHAVKGNGKVVPTPLDADNPAVIGPAGAVHCSVQDWARYAVLHLGGAPSLLREGTLRHLHTPPFGDDYAYGWQLVPQPWAGGKSLYHRGSNNYWFAVIWLAPARGNAYLAATNRGDEEKGYAGCDATVGKLLDWNPAGTGPK